MTPRVLLLRHQLRMLVTPANAMARALRDRIEVELSRCRE
jgi:hypothetical protein